MKQINNIGNPVIKGLHLRRCWKENKLENNLEVLAFLEILCVLWTSSKSVFRTDLDTVTAELVGECTSKELVVAGAKAEEDAVGISDPARPL